MKNPRKIAIVAGLLVTSFASAQTLSDIARWSGSTAIAPTNGHATGNALTLTWGFVRDGTSISGGTSNLIAQFDSTFGAGPGGNDLSQRPWWTHFNNAYNRLGAVSGLSFQYENNDDGVASNAANSSGSLGVRADLRIGGRNIDGASGTLAFNFFPNSGDMVIDTADMANFNQSGNSFRFLRNTLMHEAGHGLGCAHCESTSNSMLMEPFINTSFDGPQLHDIMMLHRGYGDKNEKTNAGNGNDTQANATLLAALNVGQTASVGNDASTFTVAANATDFVSIDDQSDIDFYSVVLNQAGTLNINLDVLGATYQVGNQGGTQFSFNSTQRSDLTLALLDSGGSVLQTVNATGLGGNEFVTQVLNAGTYGIRITGADNADALVQDTQFYRLTAGLDAVPEPVTIIALAAGATLIARRRRNG
jgi:hypothetical protein